MLASAIGGDGMDTGLYKDTVTVYTALDENSNGERAWQRTVISGVTVFRYDGAKQYPQRTLEGDDRATIYFHLDRMRSPIPYVGAADYDTLPDVMAAWTIRPDGRDRLYAGICDAEKPPESALIYRPMVVTENLKGSTRMRHIEVICK